MSNAQLDENVWILSEIYALNLLAQHELRMLEVNEFLRMALLFMVIRLKVPASEGASKSTGKKNSNELHMWIKTIGEQIQKDKSFNYRISAEEPFAQNSFLLSSSSSSSSSLSSSNYYAGEGRPKVEPQPTPEYTPTPVHVPLSAVDSSSSTADIPATSLKPQEKLQWNKNVEFNVSFRHKSQQRFQAKMKWSESTQIYRQTLCSGIQKEEIINRHIKEAFNDIHPKFVFESSHLEEFIDQMNDNAMTTKCQSKDNARVSPQNVI